MKRILKSAAVLALASVMALSASASLAITGIEQAEKSTSTLAKAEAVKLEEVEKTGAAEGAGVKVGLTEIEKTGTAEAAGVKVGLSATTEVVADTSAPAKKDAEEAVKLTKAQQYVEDHKTLTAIGVELVKAEGFVPVVDAAAAVAVADAAALLAQAAGADLAALAAGADLTALAPVAEEAAIDLGTTKFAVAKGTNAALTTKFADKVSNLTVVVGEVEGSFTAAVEGAVTKVIKDPANKLTLIQIRFNKATDTATLKLTAKSDVTVSDIVAATKPEDDMGAIGYRSVVSGSIKWGIIADLGDGVLAGWDGMAHYPNGSVESIDG